MLDRQGRKMRIRNQASDGTGVPDLSLKQGLMIF